MSARRLLHVVKATGVAGAETHLLILLEGLRAAGLDAELLILAEPEKPVEGFFTRAAARGIPAHCLAIRRRLDRGLFHNLQQFFREGGYSVVHTHLIHADVHGIPAARRAAVPHVVSTRHADNPFRRRLPLRLAHRWLWRRVDRASPSRRRCAASASKWRARRRTRWRPYTTASIPTRCRSARARAICWPPRWASRPARCWWGASAASSRSRASRTRCAPSGRLRRPSRRRTTPSRGGPLRRELETAARGFGLEGRVHFLGWRDDPHPVIAGLDVLLAPSLQEGFGLVLLEAMALRVPVIASRVSAMPEIVVDGETGLLTEPGDADGIASALSTLLANPDVAREMGANGRARLEAQFTAQRMVERTCAVYESLDAGR
ncbi:MAG: glycosyltransferase [Anaerolineae bacterium]|nr:glycosyltransferase [Anaerolineae bacterium]